MFDLCAMCEHCVKGEGTAFEPPDDYCECGCEQFGYEVTRCDEYER